MQTRLDIRPEQRLALMPEMLRSIEILQMAADDLCTLIEREVESNETLLASRKTRTARGDDGYDAAAHVPAPGTDLPTWLRLQLAWRECPADLTQSVLALAELLDERGLLPQSDQELAAAIGHAAWHDALAVLQTLEPRGVGARTAVEAMLLQLDPGDPDRDDIAALLSEHLDELARHKTPQVAKALGLEPSDIERLLQRVKELNPRPASTLLSATPPPLRVELEAHLENGQVVVRVRGGDLPELRVSPRYAAMARGDDSELRRYLRPKLAAARSLIRAVDQRRRTLLRVAAALLRRQVPFLQHGVRQMRALRMAEIATELDCHVSTVSRAIAGKWVDTEHGAFALRAFFDGAHLGAAPVLATGAPTAIGALGVLGARGVQERIRELIAAEDPARPLSDVEVATLLCSEGIEVARRTVAKYRAELGLPAQWRRRSCSG